MKTVSEIKAVVERGERVFWANRGYEVTFSFQNKAGVWSIPFPVDNLDEGRRYARRYHGQGYATKVSVL